MTARSDTSDRGAPPRGLARAVKDALGRPVVGYHPVSGGCIANAVRVDAADGPAAFLKWSAAADPAAATYPAEEDGLAALDKAGAVRVPRVLGLLETAEATGLLLEWLEPATPTRGGWRALGAALARLHRAPAGDSTGWASDNYIGTLPQPNAPAGSWAEFWWSRRIGPQAERAADTLGPLAARVPALKERLPELLEGAEGDGPSLLHGDLWSGNVRFTASGPAYPGLAAPGSSGPAPIGPADSPNGLEGALVDPSVYVGHREVDLAMTALFGGFPPEFRGGYEEVSPLAPGAERRQPAYQLYYLLVHVNLFGAGYLRGVARALGDLGV